MAGTITHSWNGTILTIISDSGTSSVDLKGSKGDTGPRGPQGRCGVILNADGTIDTSAYATESYVDTKIAEVETGSVDLSDYYTKTETVSLLNNYATKTEIPDTSSLASKTWVEDKGYLTTVDLTDYYTKAQIDAKGYLTEHQSLANYALKSEIPDVSGYQTAAQVQTLINNALGVIENGAY